MIRELLNEIESGIEASNLAAVATDRRADVIADALDKIHFPNGLTFREITLGLIAPTAKNELPLSAEPRRYTVLDTPFYNAEIITWLGYDTGIHNHPFTGVLHVLTGESLNVNYSFVGTGEDGDLKWGQLGVTSYKKVSAQSRFVFRRHTDFIHKVVHLSHECCSLRILVKRAKSEGEEAQWTFRARELALRDRPQRRRQFLSRVPLLDYWHAYDPTAFREGIAQCFSSGYRTEALNYLGYLRAKFDDVRLIEHAIVESPHFSGAAKAKLIQNFSAFSAELLPAPKVKLSSSTELFSALLSTLGFCPELARLVLSTINRELPVEWVTERLVELALSDRAVSPLAHSLLDRLAIWERGGPPLACGPSTLFSEAWHAVGFERFLTLLRAASPLRGGWH